MPVGVGDQARLHDVLCRIRFDDQIVSDVADIMNVGSKGREAGSIIAATFLKRFIRRDTPWV